MAEANALRGGTEEYVQRRRNELEREKSQPNHTSPGLAMPGRAQWNAENRASGLYACQNTHSLVARYSHLRADGRWGAPPRRRNA